jgi:hypothetical protein
MANIKTTPAQWERAKEYYEAGLLLREVSEKTKIAIPNISKKAKAEGWQKQTQKQKLISTAVSVREAKAKLSPVALTVHDEIVDERAKHAIFFSDAAVINVKEAMAQKCEGQQDFKHRADTIIKGKETVLGKIPDSTPPATTVNILTMSNSDLERIARGR